MGKRKKEALTQFNRDNIISAAKKLFETKGIEQTTVDDITKEADCSKSTLYVYFQSKQEILNTILYECMNSLKDIICNGIEQEPEFHTCYYSICYSLAVFEERYPVYYRQLLEEIKISSKETENNILTKIYLVGEEINDAIKEVLECGIRKGILKKDLKIIPTVFYLWSGISGAILFANQKQEYLKIRLNMTKEEYLAYIFKMYLNSIAVEIN